MEDWGKVINAIIEKAGITSVVIAIMASIVFYRLILEDTLWAIVVGGVSYVLLLGAIKLVASIKKYYEECRKRQEVREIEDQKNMERYRQCSIFYKTLSSELKSSLLLLYKMPEQEYRNCRIISEDGDECSQIIYDCKWIIRNSSDNYISVKQGVGSDSYIIIIDEFLYDVIENDKE